MATQYGFTCPHCGSPFPVRTSYFENPILKRLFLQCKNIECSFSAQAFIEIKYELSPSGVPNPEINLPRSPAKHQKEVASV
ncbi:ogr/Delta-like zinc finger family protein [Acinetobacter bereziniae]|uniref:ogr/Delta-like zinc finger family protein n=1 Tax=Acinetobacter bereziniae TaxID=106648 RepID=UPI002575A0CE|nr:ogr/Delta-like zinc finger family protein [Acinetobacter bereziniae]MDM1784252.1 ogr/Delta-like zinc finger family protein [Acinetobacter bereziniae]